MEANDIKKSMALGTTGYPHSFKIGDRVVYTGNDAVDMRGMRGEVIECEEYWVRVKFEHWDAPQGCYPKNLELLVPISSHLEPACTLTGEDRKQVPIYRGFMMYFPKAMQEVARLSYLANEQHNPGTEMHWDRSKSGDELDALQRHAVLAGTFDDDGQRHSAKVAWRAMANLEKELEGALS